MNRKNAVVSLLIAFAMLFTVFAVNVPEAEAAVNKNTYWIQVNKQCNVITVYKKSGSTYKPIRAMVCSTGKNGCTPSGTFRMGTKIGWCYLVGNVWAPYSMVIKGNYLFHTVPYSKKSTAKMKYKEYNKLGTSCSHGCVRLAYMDAKWIWKHCPKGTKITVYSSKTPGPLGKPKPIKMKKGWKYDPTDPNKKNKHFLLKKPAIYISNSKVKTIEKGSSYSLKSGVTAKNLNAYQSLTSKVQVYAVYKYDSSKKKYVKIKSFSSKNIGKYRIRYKVYDYYCGGSSYKNFYVQVVNPETITIDATDREVELGSENAVNAVLGVTAKQKSSDRTKNMTVSILEPGASKAIDMSYTAAQKYAFNKIGQYQITYSVKNYYYPYKKTSKSIYVTCIAPEPVIPVDPELPVEPEEPTEPEQPETPVVPETLDQPIILKEDDMVSEE